MNCVLEEKMCETMGTKFDTSDGENKIGTVVKHFGFSWTFSFKETENLCS